MKSNAKDNLIIQRHYFSKYNSSKLCAWEGNLFIVKISLLKLKKKYQLKFTQDSSKHKK